MNTYKQHKVNWKYVVIFYLVAFCLSAPFNSGYMLEWCHGLTKGTIFYESGFLFAGAGTLIAALLAFRLDKGFIPAVTTFWGNSRVKNVVITIIPVIVFTIAGIPNNLQQDVHVYAFTVSLVLTAYAFAEEIFWRGYLINVLNPLGKWKSFLILGLLWWAWHFRFDSYGCTSFLLIILVSSLLIGQFVKGTKSYLTAAGLHALIVIVNLGNYQKPVLYAGGIVIGVWLLLDKLWKTDNKPVDKAN